MAERDPRRGYRASRWASLLVRAPDVAPARLELQGRLKQAAGDRLTPALLQLADELEIIPSSEVVDPLPAHPLGQRCSTRGTVSLNCSLVFLRSEVVRYLFVHELAHTKHMNHSAGFWRLVQALEPDYRRLSTGSCWRYG